MQTTEKRQKGYKGLGMEGIVARWYARIRRSGSQIEEWRKQAAYLLIPSWDHLVPSR